MSRMLNRFIMPLMLAIIFLLFLNIYRFVPMRGDDYSYYLLGLSLESHINHYMMWSGRFIADYIASFMTGIQNRWVIVTLSSLGNMLLVYNIAAIPKAFDRSVSNITTALFLFVVFILFWISHPSMEDTVFWVVGAANYIWPVIFIVFYLRRLISAYVYGIEKKGIELSLLFGSAFLAGWSNEVASMAVLFMTLMFVGAAFYRNRTLPRYLLGSLAFNLIGTLLLVLAPGNFVRAASTGYMHDGLHGLLVRVARFLIKYVPDMLAANLYVFFAAMLIYLLYAVQRRSHTASEHKSAYIVAAILLAGFFIANAIALVTPPLPPRAMTAQFVFLLCFITASLYFLLRLYRLIAVASIALVLLPIFAFSYYLIYVDYQSLYIQDRISKTVIAEAKQDGERHVEIPHYFNRAVLKEQDGWGDFIDANMAKYYGVERITGFDVGFDYSVISDPCDFQTKVEIDGRSESLCTRAYYDVYPSRTMTLVFELDDSLPGPEEAQYFIKIDKKDAEPEAKEEEEAYAFNNAEGEEYVVDSQLPSVDLLDRTFAFVTTAQIKHPNDIGSIDIDVKRYQ
ncbi:DUF6056 family protein [Phytohalomonas tamaricis]|uniref:DUF6056 family protein n=1 Tax=Phytohalomonas tamaricis TaxID=2081032 RepID=UPI001319BF44|nr:DUF6056 family protein [Phytohalomonas tamaricis]